MAEKQKTIQKEVSFSGKGLHTGKITNVSILPAEPGFGIKFKRVDLPESPIIPALADYVIETVRGTVIGVKDATISTIEHLLASMCALHIDNAEIQVDGPEVPILNGSAKPFYDLLLEAGIQEQEADREYFEITKKIEYTEPERGVEIIAYPCETFKVDVKISYDSPILKNQFATLSSLQDFYTEISACRTFCFFREIEMMAQNNLIKGGDIDNAIVIVDKKVTQDEVARIASFFNKKDIVIEKEGILNNVELAFENEPARHKLLDVIGDLMLVGMPIKGHIIATIPGHKANTEFAKIIRKDIKSKRGPQAPKIDLYATPVVDINGIKKLLPHRYPFQLVDKIVYLSENEVVGVKNVTNNEPFFQGHFPEEPVMPGVLHLEALAQCGGVLALFNVETPELYSTYFLGMDKIKFRRKVIPGDVLVLRLKLLSPIRRGIVHMECQAFVGDQLATEGELMAQVIKNKE